MRLSASAAVLLLLPLLALLPAAARAADEPGAAPPPGDNSAPAASRSEVVWEFDSYYTDVGWYLSLGRDPIPDLESAGEAAVYEELLRNSLKPRYLLLEAAVFPMPVLGVAIRRWAPGFYGDAEIGGASIVETVTAGFKEPYSVSAFFGNVVGFTKSGEARKGTNKGMMGLLLSFATEHIKRSTLVEDRSYEIEWKMKGDRVFDDDRLSWSFRVGGKIHENPDIADSVYVGLRRSDIDFHQPVLSWVKNTSVAAKFEFAARDFRPLHLELVFGKDYPLHSRHVSLRLEVGGIREYRRLYTGSLAGGDFEEFTFVLRPKISF